MSPRPLEGWQYKPITGFDLETTSTDPETARIVTGCVLRYGGGHPNTSQVWVSDVGGAEIPAAATAVHGYTTEAARAAGRPASEVVEEIITALVAAVEFGRPLVIMNATYDLTVLDREARRHGVEPLLDRVSPYVLDPRVLDKQVSRFRSGSRTLSALCSHYVVPLIDAHNSEADALAACAVTWKIANRYAWLSSRSLAELHANQTEWAREQNASLRAYFARTPGKEIRARDVRLDWPLIPYQAGVSTG